MTTGRAVFENTHGGFVLVVVFLSDIIVRCLITDRDSTYSWHRLVSEASGCSCPEKERFWLCHNFSQS
jgi:hypothetical protein